MGESKLSDFSVDRPDEWLDVPLATAPPPWLNWTYRKLAADAGGAAFLTERAASDPFAAKTLSLAGRAVAPPAMAATAEGERRGVAQEPGDAAPKAPSAAGSGAEQRPDRPEDAGANPATATTIPIGVITSNCAGCPDYAAGDGLHAYGCKCTSPDRWRKEGQSREEWLRSEGIIGPAVAAEAPKAAKKPRAKKEGVSPANPMASPGASEVSFKPRGNAPVEAAESAVLAAERAAEERKVRSAVDSAEEAADQMLLSEVKSGADIVAAHLRAMAARDDIAKRFADTVTVDTPWLAAASVRLILEAEDQLDDLKREIAALLFRAERRLALREAILRPKLEAWAKTAERSSPKGIRLPLTTQKIVFAWQEDTYEIKNERAAKAEAERRLTLDGAIAAGVIKVREELSKSGLVAWLAGQAGSKSSAFPGTEFVAGHDAMTLKRR